MKDEEKSREQLISELAEVRRRLAEAEKLDRESQERYRLLTEHSRDAVFVVTPEGRFIEANPAACRMLGYELEEILQMELRNIQRPDSRDALLPVFARLLQDGFVFSEITLWAKGGKLIPAEINATVLPGGNYLSTVRDISERRQVHKELARLEWLNLVGQMAAGIGHEIRNPMTTIRGLLQVLGDKAECRKYHEYFDLMIGELDRANAIITEFLALARNRPEDLKLQNLNSIIKALDPLITADAMNSNKDITVKLGCVPDLLLNEKEINQLVLNLVRNGLEAMGPGGNLTIKTFAVGKEVFLSVRDQGKGINKDILEKVGTPFFTTKEHGTGLGLASCYSIAARHNATIEMETGPGGTTFLVRFKNHL